MRIPVSILLALVLSLDTFAAPVANAEIGDELALEVRAKAKVAAKKPAVKPPVKPVVKAKPAAAPIKKPVTAKPAPKPVVKAPVAKKPVAVAKPVAKAPVVAKKPVAVAKPVAKPIAKAPVAVKKPVTAAKPVAKPIAKAPVAAAKPVAVKPVAKPVTKAPVKPVAAPVAKTPVKAAPAAPAKASASAKPSKLPKCTPAQVEAREFEARERALEARLFGSSVSHPAGTGTITLFHGTTAANAAALAAGAVDLSRTRGTGDFNHRPEVPGGFYLTDSLVAAAQFACFGIPGQRPAQTDVVEYRWTGAGQQVFTFPGENADWLAFQQFNANPNPVVVTTGAFAAKAAELFTNDMIAGPLNGPADFLLTDNFQQYAVIQQAAATNNLAFQRRHQNIICNNIPTGNELTAGLYKQGQAGNAKFNTRLAKLQDPNFRPGGGSCVIQ